MKVGLVCIDMMSGRHRTSNRVIDICPHMLPSTTLSAWRRMSSDCSDVAVDVLLRVPESQSQGYTDTAESLLDAHISYHMNTYQTNRLQKKTDAEIRTRGTRGRGIYMRYPGSEVHSAESKVPLG